MSVWEAIATFCFGYPFAMAWYWMAGGLLFALVRRGSEPPPWEPPPLSDSPWVSVLVPCHNEIGQLDETLGALDAITYPRFEVIAIDDGSTDGTGDRLVEAARRYPWLRVVRLATNQGKSVALNTGAALARSEFLVCIDGDAMLDPHALHWMVRRFQLDGRVGAVSGNPRIRNRTSILGRMQVGEFSSIVGLIKRTQSLYGILFTVSGVICAFRRRALLEAGWWAPEAMTDDVDVTLRVQLQGWLAVYEPRALCWILMPETLVGLWRQRLRWSEGGTQAILACTRRVFSWKRVRLVPVWVNYMVSVAWAYTMLAALLTWGALILFLPDSPAVRDLSPIPDWWGALLLVTYLLQAAVSALVDRQAEEGLLRSMFWVIWYPIAFWILQAAAAVVGFPMAFRRQQGARGVWVSPDRGIR
jgi:biofilm PGA synthesis N-glycosyltransferase PgaC